MSPSRAPFRIAGILWTLVFGSLAFIFHWQQSMEMELQKKIQNQGHTTFVYLNRLQRKHKSLVPDSGFSFPPRPEVSYFYTYSYLYNGRNYTVTEEVSVDLYYLHKDGENLEALLFVDSRGTPHTRIKGNPLEKPGHLLFLLSAGIASFGVLLVLIGFFPGKS
ncbi:MAG TPA: hypothetical protein DEA96_10685 [Leptospiraceae bacterium]|nr:hypothetical protein [Spirochaetaceae bacterium]HBS05424.1 hypothetical protein [Leptospiraceae bacterium]|tara:strand:- start:10862 stop:11350 length:489 start_codon:yes stop_codon:yes gene_type:complete